MKILFCSFDSFFVFRSGWHSDGLWSILGLLAIWVFVFIMKGVFSFIINTSTSSLYPDYNPTEDKILINIQSLDRTISAKDFSDKYACDYLLVVQLLDKEKIKGYKKDGIWYIGERRVRNTHHLGY